MQINLSVANNAAFMGTSYLSGGYLPGSPTSIGTLAGLGGGAGGNGRRGARGVTGYDSNPNSPTVVMHGGGSAGSGAGRRNGGGGGGRSNHHHTGMAGSGVRGIASASGAGGLSNAQPIVPSLAGLVAADIVPERIHTDLPLRFLRSEAVRHSVMENRERQRVNGRRPNLEPWAASPLPTVNPDEWTKLYVSQLPFTLPLAHVAHLLYVLSRGAVVLLIEPNARVQGYTGCCHVWVHRDDRERLLALNRRVLFDTGGVHLCTTDAEAHLLSRHCDQLKERGSNAGLGPQTALSAEQQSMLRDWRTPLAPVSVEVANASHGLTAEGAAGEREAAIRLALSIAERAVPTGGGGAGSGGSGGGHLSHVPLGGSTTTSAAGSPFAQSNAQQTGTRSAASATFPSIAVGNRATAGGSKQAASLTLAAAAAAAGNSNAATAAAGLMVGGMTPQQQMLFAYAYQQAAQQQQQQQQQQQLLAAAYAVQHQQTVAAMSAGLSKAASAFGANTASSPTGFGALTSVASGDDLSSSAIAASSPAPGTLGAAALRKPTGGGGGGFNADAAPFVPGAGFGAGTTALMASDASMASGSSGGAGSSTAQAQAHILLQQQQHQAATAAALAAVMASSPAHMSVVVGARPSFAADVLLATPPVKVGNSALTATMAAANAATGAPGSRAGGFLISTGSVPQSELQGTVGVGSGAASNTAALLLGPHDHLSAASGSATVPMFGGFGSNASGNTHTRSPLLETYFPPPGAASSCSPGRPLLDATAPAAQNAGPMSSESAATAPHGGGGGVVGSSGSAYFGGGCFDLGGFDSFVAGLSCAPAAAGSSVSATTTGFNAVGGSDAPLRDGRVAGTGGAYDEDDGGAVPHGWNVADFDE